MAGCMYRWFYGDITADHAKQLLMQAGGSGIADWLTVDI